MKKIMIILTLMLILTAGQVFASSDDVTVVVDGKTIEFDVQPYIENGRTMVPVRFVAEELGAEVNWMHDIEMVTIKSVGQRIALRIGYNTAIVNKTNDSDTQSILDVPPVLKNGRTMVPLRFISETMGNEVDWDGENQIVFVRSSDDDSIKENEEKIREEIAENRFIEPVIEIVYPSLEGNWSEPEVEIRLVNREKYVDAGNNYSFKFDVLNFPMNEATIPAFGPNGWGSATSTIKYNGWRDYSPSHLYGLLPYYTTDDSGFVLQKGDIIEYKISVRNNETEELREYFGEAEYKQIWW